jgi:hypothetical protein
MQVCVALSRSLDFPFEIILSNGYSSVSSKNICKYFVVTLWLEQARLKHGTE